MRCLAYCFKNGTGFAVTTECCLICKIPVAIFDALGHRVRLGKEQKADQEKKPEISCNHLRRQKPREGSFKLRYASLLDNRDRKCSCRSYLICYPKNEAVGSINKTVMNVGLSALSVQLSLERIDVKSKSRLSRLRD